MVTEKSKEKKKKAFEQPKEVKPADLPAGESIKQEGGQVGKPKPNEILRDENGSVIGFTDAAGNVKFVGKAQTEQRFGGEIGVLNAEANAQVGEQQQTRLEAFQQQTGSQQLAGQLQENIANPPSLEPQGLGEIAGQLGFSTPESVEAQRLLSDPEKAFRNIGIGVTAGALAGFGLPFLVSTIARSAIPQAVTGVAGSIPALKTATGALGVFLVGRSALDFRGDEMDNLRSGLKKVVEDGERIEAASRNGYPAQDSISLLTDMSNEVSQAEQRIKELGNYNLNYRVSKEYILDQQNVRSAREALLRRVLAVENTAATGQASLNPEQLLFDVKELQNSERGEEE